MSDDKADELLAAIEDLVSVMVGNALAQAQEGMHVVSERPARERLHKLLTSLHAGELVK